jgi:hypothetical protein
MRAKEYLAEKKAAQPIPDRIAYIIDQMKANPEILNKVYRLVKTELDLVGEKRPEAILKPELTKPEKDYNYKGVLESFIQALNNTPGDYDDLQAFLSTYGKVSYIDTAELMKPGYSGWTSWLKGKGKVSQDFIHKLYLNLFNIQLNISGSNRGPGEVGLALLSPTIEFATVGDLKIGNKEVEVKGEKSSGGGRLKNSNADFGQPNFTNIYTKFKIPEDQQPDRLPTANARSKDPRYFQDIAMRLDKITPGAGKAYIQELFTATFKFGDQALIKKMINNYNKLDRASVGMLAMKISYSSYANILKNKGFSTFLFLKLNGEKSLAFDVDNYEKYFEHFKLGSMDWADGQNGPAVQASML